MVYTKVSKTFASRLEGSSPSAPTDINRKMLPYLNWLEDSAYIRVVGVQVPVGVREKVWKFRELSLSY